MVIQPPVESQGLDPLKLSSVLILTNLLGTISLSLCSILYFPVSCGFFLQLLTCVRNLSFFNIKLVIRLVPHFGRSFIFFVFAISTLHKINVHLQASLSIHVHACMYTYACTMSIRAQYLHIKCTDMLIICK